MNGTKHTLGPWRWNDERRLLQARYQESSALLDFVLCIDYSGHRPSVADARLIAAAPRLAAELAAWRAWAERWGRDIEASASVSPITHNELVERLAATNAALREAGVTDA